MLAILVFAYLDIHVNVIEMDVKATIEYCCFVCFVCQGSSGMAEIHRRLMKDRAHYQELYYQQKGSFFDFLKYLWNEFMPHKGFGACNDNRFTFSNCTTNWGDLSEDLFDVLMSFHEVENVTSSKAEMERIVREVVRKLRTDKKQDGKMKYAGSGPFTTVLFIQMASLLGLIPLYCFSYADIEKASLGPGSLIRNGLKKPKYRSASCNAYLRKAHQTFLNIWKSAITFALFENMACELHRSYLASTELYYKKNPASYPKPGLDILLDKEYFAESKSCDLFFNDECRDCVQNLFLVRQTGSGESELRPMLIMKHSSTNAIVRLTNWVQDGKDPEQIHWDVNPNMLSLTTPLRTSKSFRKLMKLPGK